MYTVAHSVVPRTDGHFLWLMKQKLVAAGASVAASGDGSSLYSGSGDVHTSYTTFDTANAWARIRFNAAMVPRREILIQNVTGLGIYRIAYSSDGIGFGTGGSATTLPTAADQQNVINWPSGTTRVLPPEGGSYADFVIGDETGGELTGWSFFIGVRQFGREYYSHVFFLDVLTEENALDADPAVLGVERYADTKEAMRENSSQIVQNKTTITDAGTRAWYKKGLAGAAWVVHPPSLWGHNDGTAAALVSMSGAARRWNMDQAGNWPELDCHYFRGAGFATEKGYKGNSRLFRVISGAIPMLTKNADGSRLAIGSFSIPWDNGTPVL